MKIVQTECDNGIQELTITTDTDGWHERRRYKNSLIDVFYKLRDDGRYTDEEIHRKFLPLISELIWTDRVESPKQNGWIPKSPEPFLYA